MCRLMILEFFFFFIRDNNINLQGNQSQIIQVYIVDTCVISILICL